MKMKSLKLLFSFVLLTTPLLLGLTCREDPVLILSKVQIDPPPVIPSLIPNIIPKEYNQDGTYCTKELETGFEFPLFKEGAEPKALTHSEWQERIRTFDIYISSDGVLTLLRYFKHTVCSEALIVCEGFDPINDIILSSSSVRGQEIEALQNDIDEILSLEADDEIDVIFLKAILSKLWYPIRELSKLALVATENGVSYETEL